MKDPSVTSGSAIPVPRIIPLESLDCAITGKAVALNRDPEGHGLAQSSKSRLKICLAAATPEVYSETFIRDHISRLPGDVMTILSDWPNWRYDQRYVIPSHWRLGIRLAAHLPSKVSELVKNRGEKHLASFFRHAEVVLAEFGTVGARLVRPCQIANVPLVVHFHGFDAYHSEILEKFHVEYAEMFRNAAAFVVVSRSMLEQIVSLGAPREKVYVNSCGVDTEEFRAVDAGENPPHFLGLGRFVEKKAPHLAILAFERAFRRCSGIRLTLVGDGPLLDSCRLLVRALRLEQVVDLPGAVEHERVSRLMSGCRAFVQHSVTAPSGDSEGNPVAILEAGASGLPVVSTWHAGIADTVIHGETGLLSEEADIDLMAEHIALLAENPQLAGAMGKNAAERIRDEFSAERSIERLYSVLECVARKNACR